MTIGAVGCVALAALSLALPSTLTYDPWAWAIWGREILELDLTTEAGPSWKPLPVLFTTPFALAGDAAPWLWLVVARAGGIAAVAAAFLLGRRLAGTAAGAGAAAALALAPWLYRNAALGNSEGLLVALGLLAVLRHADGARGHALLLGLGCALLRPEAWPFLALYALWLWRTEPERRPAVAVALASLPLLWLGPELWGSGDLFRAADRAQDPVPGTPSFSEHPAFTIVGDWLDLLSVPVLAGLAAAAGLLAMGRWPTSSRGLALAVGAGTLGWVALVAVMTEAGYSGNSRYLVLPAAAACVLGGAGLVWLSGAALRRLRVGADLRVLAPVAAALAFAAPELDRVDPELRSLDYQARLAADLPKAIERAGGADLLKACGRPYTGPYLVPIVAWELDVHGIDVALDPNPPAVVLRASHHRGSPPRPDPPPGAARVARAGPWEVLTDCRSRALAGRAG